MRRSGFGLRRLLARRYGVAAALAVLAVTATALLLVPNPAGRGTSRQKGEVDAPATGPLWSVELPAGFAATSVRIAGGVLVLIGPEGVLAYRADSGDALWRWDSDGEFQALVAGDAVVVARGNGGDVASYAVLDLATGRERWRAERAHGVESLVTGALLTPAVVIVPDCAYDEPSTDGSSSLHGSCLLTARSLADGSEAWSRRVAGTDAVLPDALTPGQEHDDGAYGFAAPPSEPDPDASFLLVEDVYYGGVTVVDAATGATIGEWRSGPDDEARQISGGHLYGLGLVDGTLRGLDPATGAELWRRAVRPDRAPVLPLTSVAARVYFDVAPDRGGCRIVDLATGALLPVEAAGWPVLAVTPRAVAGYDGEGRTLTAVEPASGRPLWTRALDLDLGRGEQHGRSYADERYLVLTAYPNRSGQAEPRVWTVALPGGRVATIPGEIAVGYVGGLLATVAGSAGGTYTLRLRALT